ncbi:MAG: nitrate/sulfonate/bicarbonate transporter ATPase [Rhodopila sp.]|nr:nitrate/sulfonate/bicarbonate transporter ATPase [Rhodopila sp.]
MNLLFRLLVATVFTVAGVGSASAQTMQTLNIYTVKNLLATPNFVALENGYWAEQGLDVQMKLVGSGRIVVQALQAGDAQLGHVAISGTLPIARAGGDKLISAMPYYNDPTYMGRAGAYAIIGRKDRGIDSAHPDSLLGKKICFTTGTDEYYLKQWFRRQKLDISKSQIVSLLVEDMPVTLSQGLVDAVVPWEPYVSQVIRELGPNAAIMSRGDAGLISDNVGVVGKEDWIRAHPEIVEKFVTGIAMAAKFIRENPKESAEIVARTLDGMNVGDAFEGLQHMAWDPRISVCTVEGTIRSGNGMVQTGLIKMERPFVAADFYDMTAYDYVTAKHPELFEGLPPLPTQLEDCKGKLDG